MINQHDYQNKTFYLLNKFARQRSGLNPADYGGDWIALRQEQRDITRDLAHFNALLIGCMLRKYNNEVIQTAFKTAFMGRLSMTEGADGMPESLDYCRGQYYPTEYRKACCAVLVSLLWGRTREQIPKDAVNGGDLIRARLRKEFGRSIATHYFS